MEPADNDSPAHYYQRPDLRDVWEKAKAIASDDERRKYLKRTIEYDRKWGFLRWFDFTKEWYEFTPNSVRIVSGGAVDKQGEGLFELEGERFREGVLKMLDHFDAEAGTQTVRGESRLENEEESSLGGNRLTWTESQNLFAAWVHLSYKAFMAGAKDPYRSEDTKARVAEVLGSLFEVYDTKQKAWKPVSVEAVEKKGARPAGLEKVIEKMQKTRDQLLDG